MQVVEDADRRRWVRLADVRAVVGFTASDGALAISYPDGVRRLGRPAEPHVGEEALLAHLLQGALAGSAAPAPLGRARDRLSGATRAREARRSVADERR